jgi:hypothetical protein
MSDDRRRILGMLGEGKITSDEAERLLDALGGTARVTPPPPNRAPPRYLRVNVDAHTGEDSPTRVDVRVPMNFLRAGVRLASLIPPAAREQVNAAMARQGLPFDIDQLKPENLQELVELLGELSVDVDNAEAKVRVYCE